MTRRLRPTLAVVVGIGLGLTAVACTQTDVPPDLPGPTTATTPPPAEPPEPVAGCSEDPQSPDAVVKSAPANLDYPAGGVTAAIKQRGYLRVGLDTSTELFSIVDPATGEFEGFDVEIAREVARSLGVDMRPVAIPYSQRVQVLSGEGQPEGKPTVDMVIDTFTINCARDQVIDFSTQYLSAGQKVLVPTPLADQFPNGITDFGPEQTVCAPYGSTSIANLSDPAIVGEDGPEVRGSESHGECLVLLQEGQVDALSGDDTVLAGFVAQDPNLAIIGDRFTPEPYGIGVPPDQGDWLAYVNGVLDELRTNGRWKELYDQYLAPSLEDTDDSSTPPPTPQYDS